jgi:hypothetical protein
VTSIITTCVYVRRQMSHDGFLRVTRAAALIGRARVSSVIGGLALELAVSDTNRDKRDAVEPDE